MLKSTDEWDRNRANVKNYVRLSSTALVVVVPSVLQMRDHLVTFEKAYRLSGFMWAAYGHNGAHDEEAYANVLGERDGMRALRIQIWYPMNDLHLLSPCMRREAVEATGLMHVERLEKTYKRAVHLQLLEELESRVLPDVFARAKTKDLPSLLLAHPECAGVLLTRNSWLKLVVHPVYLPGAQRARTTSMGTFRADGLDGVKMLVQYLEGQVRVIP